MQVRVKYANFCILLDPLGHVKRVIFNKRWKSGNLRLFICWIFLQKHCWVLKYGHFSGLFYVRNYFFCKECNKSGVYLGGHSWLRPLRKLIKIFHLTMGLTIQKIETFSNRIKFQFITDEWSAAYFDGHT